MSYQLDNFRFAQFNFFLNPVEIIKLPPYKGSTIRGAFGHAFKKAVCVTKEKVCKSCILSNKCVYSYIFETPLPSNSSKMRKYPFAPHPFVITPPLEEKREYYSGEVICFQLILIGRSIDFLPYFIYTFDELSRKGIGRGSGKYQLLEVRVFHPSDGEKLIYSCKDKILLSDFKVIKIDDIYSSIYIPSAIRLEFLTPTRLRYDQRLTSDLQFHILIRNLLRRISLLSYFHCGEQLDFDFKGLIEDARKIKLLSSNLRWFDWERFSSRQSTRMYMGGFIGEVSFEGDFSRFLPFLLLGEYIHVGKGTSFGLGKYKIINFER